MVLEGPSIYSCFLYFIYHLQKNLIPFQFLYYGSVDGGERGVKEKILGCRQSFYSWVKDKWIADWGEGALVAIQLLNFKPIVN